MVQQENNGDCLAEALLGWDSIANYDYNHLGCIWLCWLNKVAVTRLHISSQVITCAVQVPETRE